MLRSIVNRIQFVIPPCGAHDFCMVLVALLLGGIFGWSTAFCQVDSSLGFFPLQTGDLRQYHFHFSYYPGCSNGGGSSYLFEEVLGDTILPTGFRYKIVNDGSSVRFLRVDTVTACVYVYSTYPVSRDYLEDSLRARVGDVFNQSTSRMTQCVGIDSATLFGVQTVVKHFRVYTLPYSYYALAYGFGSIQSVYYSDDPCYPVLDGYYRDLVFARIEGQEFGAMVNVKQEAGIVPESFGIAQNYPNPFNPSTTIRYALHQRSHVTLTVFNTLGQQVARLVDGSKDAGYHDVRFDANGLASGVYFYRIQAGAFVQAKKLLLMR